MNKHCISTTSPPLLDRINIDLPGHQAALIDIVTQCAPTNTPIIIAVVAGASIDLSNYRRAPYSLLNVGYAGQQAGAALSELLFGRVSPSGRLPYSIYAQSFVDQVKMDDMNMRPGANNPGRTYRFYTGTPVFEFGFGEQFVLF
jgi:beta-D-xylosidase 4